MTQDGYNPMPLPKRYRPAPKPSYAVYHGTARRGGTFATYERAQGYLRLISSSTNKHEFSIEVVK